MDPVPSEAGAASSSGPDSSQHSGRLDAVPQGDECVGFLTGNPSVQQWKGQVVACCVCLAAALPCSEDWEIGFLNQKERHAFV